MKKIILNDLMNILEYEKCRSTYRSELMTYKKHRRISLGPNITMTFENRKTMKFQIQEMMRAERLVQDDDIQDEIDVYNSLLPDENCLSATLFLEVTDPNKIKPILNKFIGLTEEKTVYLEVLNQKTYASFEGGREEADKISSVHYIDFKIPSNCISIFDSDEKIKLGIDYKDYSFEKELSSEMQLSLHKDLNLI